MTRSPEQQAFFERSGSHITYNKLVSFLYELMRDHVCPGIVEELVISSQVVPSSLTNGWLADYAQDVASRLMEEKDDRSQRPK